MTPSAPPRQKEKSGPRIGEAGGLRRMRSSGDLVVVRPGFQAPTLASMSRSLSTLEPHTRSQAKEETQTQVPVSDEEQPPSRPPRLSQSASLSMIPLLPPPSSCVSILKTPGRRRKFSINHVDFMDNIKEKEFIRDCDITDSDIRDI